MMWIIIGMALMAGTYTIIGGLSSAINADMIQSIILIAGSVLLSIFCFNSVRDCPLIGFQLFTVLRDILIRFTQNVV